LRAPLVTWESAVMPDYTGIPYTEYIHSLGEDDATIVGGWRLRAQELVPGVEEGMSYGMPALRYRGRPLISVMATKAGYSIFPFSADVVASVLPSLEGFKSTKGGVKFTASQLLPLAAFDRMVKERQAEIDAALGSPGAASGGGRGR
jgi:uncharacterized protein YdhG (YjbR/CyaY superfamily)